MRSTLLLLVSSALAARVALAGPPSLHRDGKFWVETTTGAEDCGDGDQIKITSLGNVTVRGGSRPEVTYTIVRRVRASNESEARDALDSSAVALTRQGRYLRLAVADSFGAADLQVTIPRGLRAVLVGTRAGNIDAADLDGSVEAETGAGEARFNHIKGGVNVHSAGGALRFGDVAGWVRADTAAGDITANSIGGEARLETAGGDISVESAGTVTRAETAGGKVHIGRASGTVVAITGGGMIDIGHVGGSVTAHNSGGGINIGAAGGGAHCDSASGSIHVSGLSGAFRLDTQSGSVVAQFQGDRLLGDSSISTGSGDVTVLLPARLAAALHVRDEGASRAQSIISEFPDLQIRFDGGTAVARGDLNGGGPQLRITATSGTIFIKKK